MLANNFRKITLASIYTVPGIGNFSNKNLASNTSSICKLPEPYVTLTDIRKNWLNKLNPERDIFKRINN